MVQARHLAAVAATVGGMFKPSKSFPPGAVSRAKPLPLTAALSAKTLEILKCPRTKRRAPTHEAPSARQTPGFCPVPIVFRAVLRGITKRQNSIFGPGPRRASDASLKTGSLKLLSIAMKTFFLPLWGLWLYGTINTQKPVEGRERGLKPPLLSPHPSPP
jgi:hypothetical protein